MNIIKRVLLSKICFWILCAILGFLFGTYLRSTYDARTEARFRLEAASRTISLGGSCDVVSDTQ